jgi:type II secretory pathway component PulK
VALLTITVTEFTYSVQIDQHRTRNALHALQSQLLARSGVNLAEGFLMLDDEPAYDAYTEEWWLQLREFCQGLELDESMRIRCRVRDESGKLNINNTRGLRRRVQSQAVTADAILRDAMRCMFQRRGIEVDIVDKLADYWQQEPPENADGVKATIPEFTSLEDFGASFGIPSERLHQLRNVLTAQPSRLLPSININTAPSEVLAAVLNAESADCAGDAPIEDIVARQVDIEQPFRTTGDINSVIQGLENVDLKRRLFGVRSRLYRLEASAQTNVDPLDPTSGGIGQTLSVLVSRQQGAPPRGQQPQIGPNGNPLPTWTLRPLDWQKEGGARLFRNVPEEDENLPGNPDSQDEQDEPDDDAARM